MMATMRYTILLVLLYCADAPTPKQKATQPYNKKSLLPLIISPTSLSFARVLGLFHNSVFETTEDNRISISNEEVGIAIVVTVVFCIYHTEIARQYKQQK
jgi:hypothetical protein